MQATTAAFALHPQLQADCHALGQLSGSRLLLHRNSLLPWLILVPETEQGDFLALDVPTRCRLLEQCGELASFLKRHFPVEKINFASIGNLVPQLHLHVVGRWSEDACWPSPVWGNLPAGPDYDAQQLASICRWLVDELDLLVEVNSPGPLRQPGPQTPKTARR